MTPAAARRVHAVVAVVAAASVLFQLGLVVFGGPVLVDQQATSGGVRVLRFFEYFTIQSNILVAVVSALLVARPERDGPVWRVVRAASLMGITVTGVVAYVALRQLVDLHGADLVADRLLHQVVPLLTLLAWLVAGPRPRTSLATLGWALVWPVVWLVVALVVGAISGWYPYPFLDVGAQGVGSVTVACLLVTALFVVVGGVLGLLDRRMDPVPRPRRGAPARR